MEVVQNSQKFWVRVRQSYRTHRSSGYCTEISQELHSVGFQDPGRGYGSLTGFTEDPGTGKEVIQNSQKFRVPGIYLVIQTIFRVFTLHKGRERVWDVVPVPRVLWHGRTELTETSGTGIKVMYNSQKFRVPT